MRPAKNTASLQKAVILSGCLLFRYSYGIFTMAEYRCLGNIETCDQIKMKYKHLYFETLKSAIDI
jgi:hypothetical protein